MAAPAGEYNIICDQGATFNRTITWKDAAGNLVNLTGYTARMHVRTAYDAASTSLALTTENGRIVLGGAAGTIQLTASATETAALPVRTYVYDLELVTGATVYKLLRGTFTVRYEVTK